MGVHRYRAADLQWHTLRADEAIAALGSSPDRGLSESDAKSMLELYGRELSLAEKLG